MEPENKPGLMVEDSLDLSFTHAMQLLSVEIEKIQKGESKRDDEENYLDLFSHKNMKLKEPVLIPVKQYPKFNLWGRFLDHKEIQSKDYRKRLGQRSLSWGRVQ